MRERPRRLRTLVDDGDATATIIAATRHATVLRGGPCLCRAHDSTLTTATLTGFVVGYVVICHRDGGVCVGDRGHWGKT